MMQGGKPGEYGGVQGNGVHGRPSQYDVMLGGHAATGHAVHGGMPCAYGGGHGSSAKAAGAAGPMVAAATSRAVIASRIPAPRLRTRRFYGATPTGLPTDTVSHPVSSIRCSDELWASRRNSV